MKHKRRTPLVDATASARLLNRYVAQVFFRRFDCSRGIEFNHIVLEEKTTYQIQWENIKADLKGILQNPFAVSPRIAYSLLAFIFIFLGQFDTAQKVAFPMMVGAVSYDAAAETSHSGEPATITWSHTIGSGANRLITIFASGLSGVNDPTWAGNATTDINAVGNLKCQYYVAPSTGAANCATTGGNIKVGGSISFADVDQADPIGATTTEDGSSSPNDMALTTEADGSIRVDVLGSNRDDSNSPTGSLDSGTLRTDAITPQNQFRIGLFSYTNAQAVAGADTHQWTTSGFNRWYSAFEVKAAASGTNTNSERSAVVTGKDTANSERSATLKGKETANAERSATMVGKALTNDERGGHITGTATDDDERGAHLVGKDSASSERGGRLWGIDTEESERGAIVTGKETDASERSATTIGKATANDERSATIIGTQTDDDERGARLTGVQGANSERSATLIGTATDDDERSAKITGKDSATSERSGKLTGVEGADSERGAITTGKLATNDERSGKVTGKDTADAERGATLLGKDSANSERSAKVTGKDTDASERSARLTGKDTANSERGGFLTGTAQIISEIAAHLWGKVFTDDERGARLVGSATASSERSARIVGKVNRGRPTPLGSPSGVSVLSSRPSGTILPGSPTTTL